MVRYLPRPGGERLAYDRIDGGSPTIVWLGGFNSDMAGTKAAALAEACRTHGRGCVLFDYFGHGSSSGAFVEGTITRWRDDALSVIDELTFGPLVLVGSSMGGWIATLAALARPRRAAALVLVAPAADMTEALINPSLPPDARTRPRADRRLDAAVALRSGRPDLARPAGGRRPLERPAWAGGLRRPLAHPAGPGRRRRALAPCACPGRGLARRGRSLHPGARRRPPPVASAGHRAPTRRRRRSGRPRGLSPVAARRLHSGTARGSAAARWPTPRSAGAPRWSVRSSPCGRSRRPSSPPNRRPA